MNPLILWWWISQSQAYVAISDGGFAHRHARLVVVGPGGIVVGPEVRPPA